MNFEQRERVIFSGTYERTLDSKNRVTIPSVWVEYGVTEFQVVPSSGGGDPYLIVLPPWEFAMIEERINGTKRTESEKRLAIRAFYSAARQVILDKQGRMLLPEDYCRRAELGSEVALLGAKSRFEIWNAERWRASLNRNAGAINSILDEAGL
ncbi:MAG: hypothetical protein N2035_09345 [Chthoniobacterales bacterium]|nr:hypothetical protein [Chthoniobacterales bacterium]